MPEVSDYSTEFESVSIGVRGIVLTMCGYGLLAH